LNKPLKIASIGPYLPFRGGISDFHQDLIKQLKISNDVEIINFKKLYPNFLFPGKSQTAKKNLHSNHDSRRILNPLNIFSWTSAVQFINKFNADIIIISYWHPFFALMYSFIAKKVKCKKIYFLIHNAQSHEHFPLEKLLVKNMLKQATHIVTMNDKESDKIANFNLQGKILNSFHPIYLKKFNELDRSKFKHDLGLNQYPVILFFGLIRPYKGLDILINTVNLLKKSIPELKVLVVGESYMSMKQYHLQVEKNDLQDFFIFNNNFVNEDKLKKYFLSSDLVVLPYKKSTQSGVLALSMNFNIPSLVSSNGGLKDYIINNKTGFISSLNPEDISVIIEKYFNDNLYKSMSKNIKNHKKNFNWYKFEESLQLNDN
tara:strand:+ start:22 stop:1143 length:1122 start_codon:yes stop_codon:yes gene_type:complete